jgi:hypothetical protein
MEQRTERVIPPDATKRFLRAVLQAAKRDGFPVNAYMIGPDVFKGDHVFNWNAIRAVLRDCQERQLLVVTSGGEIQEMSDAALVIARHRSKPVQTLAS